MNTFGDHRILAEQYNIALIGGSTAIPIKVTKGLMPQEGDRITLVYISKQKEENRITAIFDALTSDGKYFFVVPLEYEDE